MVAAENQGVIDDVIWGSATPANDSSVAAAVGSDWDGKLLINAEFQPTDFDGPDTDLYNQVSADYAPDSPLSSFGQMGFLTGRIFVSALLSMGEGAEYTPEAVNAAIVGHHEVRVRHLLQAVVLRRPAAARPQQLGHHGGARLGRGRMVPFEDCFEIAALDQPLIDTRAAEEELGLGAFAD